MTFTKKLIYFVESTDVFGEQVSFTIGKHDFSKTLIGGIVSILLLSSMITLFLLQIRDSFWKENPTISNFLNIKDNRDSLNLNLESMPMAFGLNDKQGETYDDLMYLSAEKLFRKLENGDLIELREKLDLVKCTKDNFSFLSEEKFKELKLNKYFCMLKQNVSIFGYMNDNSTSLNIKVSYCNSEEIQNSNDLKCEITSVMDKMQETLKTKNLFLKVFYQNSVFNSNNYTHPIKKYIDAFSLEFDLNIQKFSEIFVEKHSLITEDGLILNNSTISTIYSLDGLTKNDFRYRKDNTMIDINIFSSNKEYTFRRVYNKIQSSMADVFALYEYLRIFLSCICLIFTNSKKNTKLMNKLYEFDFGNLKNFRTPKRSIKTINEDNLQQDGMNLGEITEKNDLKNTNVYKRASKMTSYKFIKIIKNDDANKNSRVSLNQKNTVPNYNNNNNFQNINNVKVNDIRIVNDCNLNKLELSPSLRNKESLLKISSEDSLIREIKSDERLGGLKFFNKRENITNQGKHIENPILNDFINDNNLTNLDNTNIEVNVDNTKNMDINNNDDFTRQRKNAFMGQDSLAYKNFKNSNTGILNKTQFLKRLSNARPQTIKTIDISQIKYIKGLKGDEENNKDDASVIDSPNQVKAIQIDLTDYYRIRKNLFKKRELLLTNFEIIKIFLFKCCIKNKHLKVKGKLYKLAEDKLRRLLDIRTVLTKLEEFEKLKFVLMNGGQISMLNLSSRELCSLNIDTLRMNMFNQYKDFQNDKIRMNKEMDFYNQNLNEMDEVSEVDQKLIRLLPEEVRTLLVKRQD